MTIELSHENAMNILMMLELWERDTRYGSLKQEHHYRANLALRDFKKALLPEGWNLNRS